MTLWLAIVGVEEGEWRLLYQDPCGTPAAPEGMRTFP